MMIAICRSRMVQKGGVAEGERSLVAIAKDVDCQAVGDRALCNRHAGRGNNDRALGNIAGGFDAAAAIGKPHYSIICHSLPEIACEAGTIGGKSLRSIKVDCLSGRYQRKLTMRPGKSAGPLSIACRAPSDGRRTARSMAPLSADQHRARDPRPRGSRASGVVRDNRPHPARRERLDGHLLMGGLWTGIRGATVPCADPRPENLTQ